VVDVGCRWGFAAAWEQLADHCQVVGFDPDVVECERLREHYRSSPQVEVVALALGAESGPATLHVTKDPSGNSLYPTVTDVVERFPALAGGQVDHTLEITLTTLDEWCAEQGRDRVDVIKIDTQGSELEVLKGAARTLATVRAIEVEVEFNPLYEGVALFGDIDRFLRAHGFVLWRLRDLAHYAQLGSATDWRAQETQHYDGYQARYHAGAGQLFWANAYFVKADVAAPDRAAGWAQLVRDACVTSAMGFRDLARVAIEHARVSAPAEVDGALELALSEERTAARRQAELCERSEALEGTMTIEVDDPRFQGPGWLPAQRIELGAVRWTGPAREASVDLPIVLRPGTRVELLSFGGMSPTIIETLALEVNRVVVPLARSIEGTSILYAGTLPATYASTRPFTRLLVRTAETIPWNEANPDSTDDTELGFALSWVRLTAP
jgi:FkbM family methyltransferase